MLSDLFLLFLETCQSENSIIGVLALSSRFWTFGSFEHS